MLKTAFSFLLLLACMATAWAQTEVPTAKEPEVLFQGEVNHGFYLAPSLQLTRFHDKSGFMVGGRAAWLMNHKVAIGLAGYGLTTQTNIGEIEETNNAFLQVGYGGALLEYIPEPDKLFHLTFPLMVGLGGAAYTDNFSDNQNTGNYSYEVYDTDAFMVVEPGVQAELNLARFMRLGLTFSYRFTHGVSLPKTSDKDLSTAALTLTAKFGRF
ncbi:hypothetical protein TH61_11165 [Rufibacter sp. DG15C]|uniref:hypothetical protein n=1 Tax=Rufibacter sp. DG15C TaxID=1379909 RepID=UPI00078DAA7D|nr:hypothetical protein [Rufibacter sp. DG15C]AMM51620.1 hypothetical protein TH61_11165 [Rufibacter sp. DG15C]